jgi:TetR/AcrR family transcriptional regulator of autoinduction and epiphytic fitness
MKEPVKKRNYVSPARRAKAEATRERIIDAATRLFLETGYSRTSTAVIAKAAKTSEASVFAAFGSKANLLVDVVLDRVGRDPDFPPRDQPAWQALAAASDKGPAFEAFARAVRRVHDRSWRLLAIAAAAAQDDPAVDEAVGRGAAQRRARAGWFVKEIIGIAGPDEDRKTDEVWTLISVENYRRLVVERDWPRKRYEAWLAAMLAATLA